MNARITLRKERIARCIIWGADHAALFVAGSRPATTLAALKPLLADLENRTTAQDNAQSNARAAPTQLHHYVDAVYFDLVSLSKVSHAEEKEFLALKSHFALPSSEADAAIITAARSALSDLKAHPEWVALFIEYGMPADFVADLESDLTSLESAEAAQTRATQGHVADTAKISELVSDAGELIKKLDAFLEIRLANTPALLESWKRATALEIRRVHPHRKTPPTA